MSSTLKASAGSQSFSQPSVTLEGKPFSDYLDGLLLKAGVKVCHIEAGEQVFAEGDSGDTAYFIRAGNVEIRCRGPEGCDRVLSRLGSGEVFGEMALLDQTQRSASAIALESTELFVISRDRVVALLHDVPEMALWMLKLLSRRLRLLTRSVSQMERVHEVNMKILAGQEQERRRIGRNIHDGLAQFFAGYILRLQFADQLLDRDLDRARAEMVGLEDDLRSGIAKVRELIHNLYPQELSQVGLVGAIQRFADRIGKSAGIEIIFIHRDLPEEPPAALEATLYCIIQEALNNVRRHAQASRVDLELRCKDTELNLVIADNGRGFDVNRLLDEQAQRGSYGLLSMQDRTELAGGRMELESRPGAGTTLRFRVPLRAAHEA